MDFAAHRGASGRENYPWYLPAFVSKCPSASPAVYLPVHQTGSVKKGEIFILDDKNGQKPSHATYGENL
jgi:hypothetical protein